jgi:hypothetical protein
MEQHSIRPHTQANSRGLTAMHRALVRRLIRTFRLTQPKKRLSTIVNVLEALPRMRRTGQRPSISLPEVWRTDHRRCTQVQITRMHRSLSRDRRSAHHCLCCLCYRYPAAASIRRLPTANNHENNRRRCTPHSDLRKRNTDPALQHRPLGVIYILGQNDIPLSSHQIFPTAFQAPLVVYACVEGTGTLVDIRGNKTQATVMSLCMSRNNAAQVQWNNVNSDNLPEIADSSFIHPSFAKSK